ncbi:hypothetical protein [Allochromatium warmingii]|nr:hypothetical protein [Allochromatium warmingii]
MRRRWPIMVPVALVWALWALFNPLIPPLYRSTATLRIEPLMLPSELATSPTQMRQHVEHRLRLISQRVLSPSQLAAVIEQQALYPNLRQRANLEAAQAQLRQQLAVQVTDIALRPTLAGEPRQVTVTYTLSFRDPAAHVAQSVTQELAALFLRENETASRSNHSPPPPLHAATEQLAAEITALQAQLSAVEQQPSDAQAVAAVTAAYQQTVAKYRALRERSLYAEQAQSLAREQQGARFTLLQSPPAPTQPDAVQRFAWLGVGVLLAVAASLLPLTWLERCGGGLRGVRALHAAAPIPLLGVIPYIETAAARQARIKRTLVRGMLAVMLTLAALSIFQQLVMPLEIFGARLWQALPSAISKQMERN